MADPRKKVTVKLIPRIDLKAMAEKFVRFSFCIILYVHREVSFLSFGFFYMSNHICV